MSKWLQNMNPEQQQVILHKDGPLGVFAVAGCGKTRALVHRIGRLVAEEGVPAHRILAVTFSKKAADEMNERLDQLGVTEARVGTWHSLCLQILKQSFTPYADWDIDDGGKHRTIVKEAVGFKNLDWKGADVTKICRFIGLCKANLWTPDDADAETLAEDIWGDDRSVRYALNAYRVSDQMVAERGILPFDDFLVLAHRHLVSEMNRQEWASKWDYVLQDEAQDANRAQIAIASKLASDHRNYMIVGDPAQSIYGFRGSSPSYLMQFEKEWQAKVVYMNRNYRSGNAVIETANKAIEPAKVRLPVQMLAERGVDGEVSITATADLDDEAFEFVGKVQEHVADGGKHGDITCLYRTNAQSRALEEALLSARIPYTIVGATNFYERREVKSLLGYLRAAIGVATEDDIKRTINAPFRYLGAAFQERLLKLAKGQKNPNWAALVEQTASETGIQNRQRSSAADWARLIESIADMTEATERDTMNPGKILAHVVHKTSYIEWLQKEEGEESIEASHAANVREMIRVAEKFATVKELLDYVEDMGRKSKNQRSRSNGDRVLLMSIHRSKGLEWPIVWVVGCNETIFPHARAEDVEEERRLFYVATTRARDTLHLSYVGHLATKGGVKAVEPSRFLLELSVQARTSMKRDEEDDYSRAEREALQAEAG